MEPLERSWLYFLTSESDKEIVLPAPNSLYLRSTRPSHPQRGEAPGLPPVEPAPRVRAFGSDRGFDRRKRGLEQSESWRSRDEVPPTERSDTKFYQLENIYTPGIYILLKSNYILIVDKRYNI